MAEKLIRLLIVDDQVIFLRSISGRLHLRGFEITVASSSKEALEAAREGQFDLAVLDLKIPGMDGKQVLEILKRKHRCTEVIILTHHGSFDSNAECTKPGEFIYLPKPYRLQELLEVLGRADEARLRKEFERDDARTKRLQQAAHGRTSPVIPPAMRELDDDEK